MDRSDNAPQAAVELKLPPVIGHRGAAAVAPENTLAGLRRAHALGCRWVEFDVRLTGDSELILLHDDRLERTTNGRGKARRLPLSAIRRCDAGSWFDPSFAGERVPTLAEAIALLSELGLGANLELKAERGDDIEIGVAAADIVARSWPSHLPAPLITSFAADAIGAVRERAPRIACGLLLKTAARNRWRRAQALDCATVNADQRHLRPTTVAELRKAEYAVLAYTVNDAARALELFEWGVSSVFSDVPDVILAAIPEGWSGMPAAWPRIPARIWPDLPL
jgi:glycerophosphoryl diester phosphodiesterase